MCAAAAFGRLPLVFVATDQSRLAKPEPVTSTSVFTSFLLDATLGTTTMPLVNVNAFAWLKTPAAVVTESAYGPPGECAGTVAVKLVPLGDTDWICSGTPPMEALTVDGKFVP